MYLRWIEKISTYLTLIGMRYESSLAGCQIIVIDLNFYLQKCMEIFDKDSADKNAFAK